MKKMNAIAYIDDVNKWKEDFSFSIPIKIRFSETDMFGHMNNVSAFIYFEEARIEFLKFLGLFDDVKNKEAVPIVADLQCDFHRQVFFDDSIHLYVKTVHVGKTSFDLHYMALDKRKEICLTGRGRLVNVNPITGKPVPLSDEVIKTLLTEMPAKR